MFGKACEVVAGGAVEPHHIRWTVAAVRMRRMPVKIATQKAVPGRKQGYRHRMLLCYEPLPAWTGYVTFS